jgi:hypothetical protein
MKTYNGTIIKVRQGNDRIRFGWHDPSLFDREREFSPKLPPNANFNGIYQTHNGDVTQEGIRWLHGNGVLRIVDSTSRVMLEMPVYKIPSVMSGKVEFFKAVLGSLNEDWYGELSFPGTDWSKVPDRLWTRFDVVDQGKVLLAQKR